MDRRIVLGAAGGAVAVVLLASWALAGKGGGSGRAQAQSTTTVPAVSAVSAAGRTITVQGVASVSGVPDTATVSLGVQVHAPTATEAWETTSGKVQTIIDVLTKAGVGKADIRTMGVYLTPDYRDAGSANGYWGGNSVQATIHDVSKVGPALDAAARTVGDGVTLGGVSFSIDDTSQLYAHAREMAVGDARTRAGQLAAAAGVTLGPVLSMDASTQSSPVPYAASAATTVAGPAVEPGRENLQLTVQVVFGLMA
jgi:uncharacterized protein